MRWEVATLSPGFGIGSNSPMGRLPVSFANGEGRLKSVNIDPLIIVAGGSTSYFGTSRFCEKDGGSCQDASVFGLDRL